MTDTGTSGELARAPETAQASVAADVVACPDGGVSDAGQFVPPQDACVGGFENPSIEGTPQTEVIGLWDAPGWNQCPWLGLYPTYLANRSTNPSTTPTGGNLAYPDPTNGRTYAVIQERGHRGRRFFPEVGFGQQLLRPAGGGQLVRGRRPVDRSRPGE